ncbi:MAG TPA: MBL fold metallo-hydrolase [Vicinamibacterales bacterium]|jgi:metallo-beta-lactamase class B|nr:MBL fold metallo-hydrolase [Vicinamibacterales bacterium]
MKRLLAGLLCAVASSLVADAQTPLSPEVERHIEAARAAAGAAHAGLFDAVCTTARNVIAQAGAPPRAGGAGRAGGGRAGGPPAAPARETWHAEPVKVFDNLYFLGQTEFSVWAIATSQGIILLDAIFDYSVEDEVVGGLKKLGLDPAQIKYVMVSHGHLDHAGGARFLQEKFGARLLMSAADYDLLDRDNPSWKPKRDMIVTDGQQLTLGDTTLTFYVTPGHTEGTVSTVFPVRDGNQRHVVAEWGGTLFNFGPIRPRLQAYAASAERFKQIAAKAGADVILSNHTVYDGSKTKLPAVLARKPGEPHPYVVGPQVVQRYLTTVGECAQAAVAGLPAN